MRTCAWIVTSGFVVQENQAIVSTLTSFNQHPLVSSERLEKVEGVSDHVWRYSSGLYNEVRSVAAASARRAQTASDTAYKRETFCWEQCLPPEAVLTTLQSSRTAGGCLKKMGSLPREHSPRAKYERRTNTSSSQKDVRQSWSLVGLLICEG
jgi:hypothetical protein